MTKTENQSLKAKLETNKTQQAFLGHLRHELRTPLNAIIGYSEMLLEDAKDLGQKSLIPGLEHLHSSGKEMLALVNDILDPAKIDSGLKDLDLKAIGAKMRHAFRPPLNTLISYSDRLMEDAKEKGQMDFIPDLERIRSAAEHFQTLINDMVNSSKIETKIMDPDMEALDSSTVTREVMSTTPLLSEEGATKRVVDQGSLLVVDDKEMNRDLLHRQLGRQGYTVTVAENGQQALEIVKTDTFDLILLDIMMPGLDGYEVCRRLKSDPQTTGIPIIFVTAMDEIKNKTFGFELGAVDYITKPFEMSEVLARIRTHLALKRSHEELKRTIQHLNFEINERKRIQAKLVQSEKMASIGLLASGIAHEINNPTVAFKRGTDQLMDVINNVLASNQKLETVLTPQIINPIESVGTKVFQSGFKGTNLTTKQSRKKAKEYEQSLASLGIKDYRNISRDLSRMGLSRKDFETTFQTGSNESFLSIISYLNYQFELGSIINMMKISSDRIIRITESLKRYSHMDRGPEDDIQIEDGIEDTLVMLQNELKYGVETERDYKNVPKINCYPSELAQVWTNIIHNAVQAMDGKGKLRIETFEEGDYIGARFTDSGPGIPEEAQAKIFEPFFSTKDQGEGTGLGLTICYQIIEKHEGRINLTSKPGETTFEVLLPLNVKTD